MLSSNIVHRTLRIRFGDAEATCFLADFDRRQYLVTAKHVMQEAGTTDRLHLYMNGEWREHPFSLTGFGEGLVDIAVVALDYALFSNIPSVPSDDGLIVGQDVYFAGFPYGLNSLIEDAGFVNPIPLIKKACLSAMHHDSAGRRTLLLDGHNNPGFSGSPVIFGKRTAFGSFNPPTSIAGVISGFKFTNEPVFIQDKSTDLTYKYNTGIVIAYGIQYVQAIVVANPNGAELPVGN